MRSQEILVFPHVETAFECLNKAVMMATSIQPMDALLPARFKLLSTALMSIQLLPVLAPIASISAKPVAMPPLAPLATLAIPTALPVLSTVLPSPNAVLAITQQHPYAQIAQLAITLIMAPIAATLNVETASKTGRRLAMTATSTILTDARLPAQLKSHSTATM